MRRGREGAKTTTDLTLATNTTIYTTSTANSSRKVLWDISCGRWVGSVPGPSSRGASRAPSTAALGQVTVSHTTIES